MGTLLLVLALAAGWLLRTPEGGDAPPVAEGVASDAAPPPAELSGPALPSAPSPAPEAEAEAEPGAGERSEVPFAAPPAGAAGSGRVRGKVVWADDGAPVAGVALRLELDGTASRSLRAPQAIAGGAGEFTFDDVPARVYSLTSAFGGSAVVKVTSGKEVRTTLQVVRGARVRGVVRDEHGQPVADAGIWLSEANRSHTGTVVARTDVRGEFQLPSVHGARWIGARARGYRASAVSLVEGKQGEERRLELALVRSDARVHGFVRDPHGKACARAVVLASPPGKAKWQAGLDGSQQLAWVPVQATTDDAGAFALEGLPPGELVVRAHAPPFGKASETITVAAGALGDVTLVLPVAARVEGRVTDGNGAPAANAFLYFAGFEDIDLVWARCDADGNYAADGVSPGALPVQVWHRRRLALSATLELASGEARVWNPVLAGGATLAGRVVDSSQQPLGNFSVAIFRGERSIAETRTDAEGRFTFADVEAEPVTLRVGAAYGGGRVQGRLTVLAVPDVTAPREDLVLVVPDDRLPSVTVIGRVLRADGQPATTATLRLGDTEGRGIADANTDARGVVQLSQVLPGSYWISVLDPEHPTLVLGLRPLAPRAQVDLGDLQLTTGGTILVTPRLPAGLEGSDLAIALHDAQHRNVGSMQRTGESLRSPLLPAGPIALVVSGAGIARARREVEVQAGSETRVELLVERGRHRIVRAELPSDAPPQRWVWSTIYCGKDVLGGCGLQRAADGAWTAELWLPAQDAEVWVGTAGQKWHGQAAIAASLPDGAVVPVALQPR